MAKCDRCGAEESMPYRCRMCGGTYCGEHRLPENHDCPGLEEWNDPGGVFDSGFDDSVDGQQADGGRLSALTPDLDTAGLGGLFRNNVTFLFLGLMWATFALQYFLAPAFGVEVGSLTWYRIFTINTARPLEAWTWVVSVFAHGGIGHIFINSLVLYFFGPLVESRTGSKTFAALFLVSGAVAGLGQVAAALLTEPGVFSGVLGASGAIMAIMGVLTVLNPNLRIYVWFVLPMPLWVATGLFAAYSIFVSTTGGVGAGNVAQVAHLAGLAVGLVYGYYLKQQGERAPSTLQFGGGGGGGPGGPGRGRGPF